MSEEGPVACFCSDQVEGTQKLEEALLYLSGSSPWRSLSTKSSTTHPTSRKSQSHSLEQQTSTPQHAQTRRRRSFCYAPEALQGTSDSSRNLLFIRKVRGGMF